MKTQKQIWNDIAPEWLAFKKTPSILTTQFLQKQKGKILDLGSGSGRHLMKLKNAKMYLVDFSEKMIELAKEKSKKVFSERGDLINNSTRARRAGGGGGLIKSTSDLTEFAIAPMSKLPYENNFFDSAICISALHCVETKKEREKTIKELHRVLKLSAQVLVAVWNKNSKRFKRVKTNEKLIGWKNFGKRYYYLYEEKELHDLFKKTGFKIIKTQNSPLMIRFIAQKI